TWDFFLSRSGTIAEAERYLPLTDSRQRTRAVQLVTTGAVAQIEISMPTADDALNKTNTPLLVIAEHIFQHRWCVLPQDDVQTNFTIQPVAIGDVHRHVL